MAIKNKESSYWILVGLYGALLFIALLYLRFPGEDFRAYCEHLVEKALPGVNCTISKVSYDFPVGLHFEKMRISRNGEQILLDDDRFSVAPAWTRLTSAYAVESQAFGGRHSALLSINDEEGRIIFNELRIANLPLEKIPVIGAMERPLTGILSGEGTAMLNSREIGFHQINGIFTLTDSRYELGRPLFLMADIEVPLTTFRLAFNEGVARLTAGAVRTAKVEGDFQGDVTLADSLADSRLKISGNLTPKAQLFPGSRQLQAVVAGVQRRYRSEELPFKIGGSLGQPSFIFSK